MTDENTVKPEESTSTADATHTAPASEAEPASPDAAHEIAAAVHEPAIEPAAKATVETHSEPHHSESESPGFAESTGTGDAATEPPVPTETETETKPKKPRKSKATAAAVAATHDSTATPEAALAEAATTDSTDAAAPLAVPAAEPVPESKRKWYAVKVQSGREDSIKAAIERKVKIEGLEEFFGQIVIPVEEVVVKKKLKVKNKKTGETTTQEKNATKYNKKFQGYLFAEVEFNDQILYVFRETSGVGDFVGINSKRKPGATEPAAPTPMTDDEVRAMLSGDPGMKRKPGQPSKTVVKLDFEKGDKVRIKNGAFLGSEGEVKSITTPKDPTETPKVTVVVTFWGRPLDLEVDYWEVDKV
jgi:transcription termination/antitermination protein NusG